MLCPKRIQLARYVELGSRGAVRSAKSCIGGACPDCNSLNKTAVAETPLCPKKCFALCLAFPPQRLVERSQPRSITDPEFPGGKKSKGCSPSGAAGFTIGFSPKRIRPVHRVVPRVGVGLASHIDQRVNAHELSRARVVVAPN